MASCDNFEITVKGVSAHGSAPHLGRDAIVAAASVIMNLQTFASRNNDPLNPLVVTVGVLKGGQRFNIIANEVKMEGTIRTYSRKMRTTIEADLRRIVTCAAQALGCEADFDYHMYLGPVINEHDDLNRIARDAAVKLYGEESLAHMDKTMGSEDFSMLMDRVPGVYCFIGCRNPAAGKIYPNHNDKFDVDESVLHRGAAFYAQFAVDYLTEKA
jgi:amidohydrolase